MNKIMLFIEPFKNTLPLDAHALLLIILIIALAGFISGLSGFGFSAVGVMLLWVMNPTRAIPLLMALSIANQLLSISQLKEEMIPLSKWWSAGPATYILGGFFGVPAGVWIMANLPASELTFAIGMILLIYSTWMVLRPVAISVNSSGPFEHILVGMVGGAIGGFTAFPGCAVVIWAGLRNLSKTEQRGIVQPYILAMQMASLLSMIYLHSGDLNSNPYDSNFWILFAFLLPVVLPMTKLEVAAFKSLSDVNFKNITLGVLALSGSGLAFKGFEATFIELLFWVTA